MTITKKEVLNEIEQLMLENEVNEVQERIDLIEEYLFLMEQQGTDQIEI